MQESEKSCGTWSTSVVDLGSPDVSLTFPLVVQIEDYEKEYIASWPEVEAWGGGITEAQAINALKDSILDLIDDLWDEPEEKLGELPLRWKRALLAVVRKKEASS
jgi:hypothetical protein